MDFWQMVVATTFTQAILLGALGWLLKSIIGSSMQRDMKRFEDDLKSKADAAIEKLKSDLQLRSIDHQVKLSKLHEERAEVVRTISGLVAEIVWAAEDLFAVLEVHGEASKREKHIVASEKLVEFFRYFDKHKIYLPSELCDSLEEIVLEVRNHVIRFGIYINSNTLMHTVEFLKEEQESWTKCLFLVHNRLPGVRRKLEDEFRLLLAPINSSAPVSPVVPTT